MKFVFFSAIMSNLLLSIIDNDQMYKFYFKRMFYELAKGEYSIVKFINGEEAINFLKKKFIDNEQLPDIIF